jgi:hypothetical protein
MQRLAKGPGIRKMLLAKGVVALFGRNEGQFPKLDVVGSNPIARS